MINVGVIENGVCINVTVFENEEDVAAFREADQTVQYEPIPEGFWIGDKFQNGVWSHPEVEQTEETEKEV